METWNWSLSSQGAARVSLICHLYRTVVETMALKMEHSSAYYKYLKSFYQRFHSLFSSLPNSDFSLLVIVWSLRTLTERLGRNSRARLFSNPTLLSDLLVDFLQIKVHQYMYFVCTVGPHYPWQFRSRNPCGEGKPQMFKSTIFWHPHTLWAQSELRKPPQKPPEVLRNCLV